MRERCADDAGVYEEQVGQYHAGPLYRSDGVLPVPHYVMRCLRAQRRAGDDALANFLDASFLADGETPLRQHLESQLRGGAGGEQSGPSYPLDELRDFLRS